MGKYEVKFSVSVIVDAIDEFEAMDEAVYKLYFSLHSDLNYEVEEVEKLGWNEKDKMCFL